MANTIQMRRGTAANATTNNVVLAAGEWGYETDTGKVKIGDGTTAWNDLPYFETAKNHEFACSNETADLETGTVYAQRFLKSINNCTKFDFSVVTAPTGSTIIIDVHKNGATVFDTKPTIDAAEFTTLTAAVPQVITGGTVSFAAGDLIEVIIDQVGSTVAGVNLKAQITYNT